MSSASNIPEYDRSLPARPGEYTPGEYTKELPKPPVNPESAHTKEAVGDQPLSKLNSLDTVNPEHLAHALENRTITHEQVTPATREPSKMKAFKQAAKEDLKESVKQMMIYKIVRFGYKIGLIAFTKTKASEAFNTTPLDMSKPSGKLTTVRVLSTAIHAFKDKSAKNDRKGVDSIRRMSSNPSQDEFAKIELKSAEDIELALESIREKGDAPFIFDLLQHESFRREAKAFADRLYNLKFEADPRRAMDQLVRDMDAWAEKYIPPNDKDPSKMATFKVAFLCANPRMYLNIWNDFKNLSEGDWIALETPILVTEQEEADVSKQLGSIPELSDQRLIEATKRGRFLHDLENAFVTTRDAYDQRPGI